MNELEQECIILNSAWDMLNGMVNWAMFCKHDRTENVTMMFETRQQPTLNVLMLFSSTPPAVASSPTMH